MSHPDRTHADGPGSSALALNKANFDPDGSCQWIYNLGGGLEIYGLDGSYIAAPGPDQDRTQWLDALRQYRVDVRAGKLAPQSLDLNFNSERAWIRLANPMAKALALAPGDRMSITLEARWLEGNNELCFALDRNLIEGDQHAGWSGVLGTGTIERDGEWHTIFLSIDVPADLDINGIYLRPIVGMDATYDSKPGHVQIRQINISVPDAARMEIVRGAASANVNHPLDRSLYDEPSQTWMQGAFTCHFTFMYDRSFYNPETGEYQLDRFLDEGEREFGGYDILLLWHAYPRIGLDGRNQLDFYRDMPGGLDGIHSLVDQAHARGVKVFINYNPWDRATAREGKADEDFLVDLVATTDMDGIFLDTMVGDSPELRRKLEVVRPGVSLTPECNPSIQSLAICNGSWAQGLSDEHDPGLNHLKWIEPRHMRWRIFRWNTNHREEIRHAFFNGSGMMVWENVFGSHVRWTLEDRRMWRRASAILRQFKTNFSSDAWEPFIQPASHGEGLMNNDGGLFIHRWPGEKATVYTIYLKEPRPAGVFLLHDALEVPLLREATNPGIDYYDVWNGKLAHVEQKDGQTTVFGLIDRISGLASIAAVPKSRLDGDFIRFITNQRSEAERPWPTDDERGLTKSVIDPKPVAVSKTASRRKTPEGMVLVSGGPTRMKLEHMRRECGCYPDPGTPFDQWEKYYAGAYHWKNITHDYTVDLDDYYIDETAVTNAQFKKFMDDSGYMPMHSENFLKHWPGGVMPEALAGHPVVYVDLNDARAYAEWAGKRLPTEPEWQRAAQGTDGRKWPWGNAFDLEHPDPVRVNTTGATLPARALPDSRSPYGCYQMSGNVYEWTESERDDGFTRFCIIRGGSYMKVEGSIWYMDGGPRPCDHHTKLIMMWPGLDRCSTIGFRCVKDVRN